MTNPVNVAILGLGQRGLQHLKELWQLQSEGLVRVSALADAFADNLEEAKLQRYVSGFQVGEIIRTTTFDTLLDSPPDVLYVCLPPNVHNGEVKRAAQAGIHLFVEKPMSLYLDEALEMNAAIAQAGVLSTVGFQQRFDSRHEKIHHLLRGKPAVMVSYTAHLPLEFHNAKHTHTEDVGGPTNRVWTASQAWSGTTMVEGGIHPLDLWRYWFGDISWVQAQYVHRPPEEVFDGADNPYAYAATFGFECGAVGNMLLSRLRRAYHHYIDHQVLWNEGRIVLEGGEVAVYHYDGEYPPAQPPSSEQVRQTVELPPSAADTYAISRTFIQAIVDQKPELIRSPFPDAMNSLAAVIGANVSDALNGERISIDDLLNAERFTSFRQK